MLYLSSLANFYILCDFFYFVISHNSISHCTNFNMDDSITARFFGELKKHNPQVSEDVWELMQLDSSELLMACEDDPPKSGNVICSVSGPFAHKHNISHNMMHFDKMGNLLKKINYHKRWNKCDRPDACKVKYHQNDDGTITVTEIFCMGDGDTQQVKYYPDSDEIAEIRNYNSSKVLHGDISNDIPGVMRYSVGKTDAEVEYWVNGNQVTRNGISVSQNK